MSPPAGGVAGLAAATEIVLGIEVDPHHPIAPGRAVQVHLRTDRAVAELPGRSLVGDFPAKVDVPDEAAGPLGAIVAHDRDGHVGLHRHEGAATKAGPADRPVDQLIVGGDARGAGER